MSVYVDRKYLLLSSALLSRFTVKKDDLYNFRCPFCGDSEKNLHRARGYVYRKSNDYFYRCHNCSVSTTFAKFLQFIDPARYREYVLEKFIKPKEKKIEKPNVEVTKKLDDGIALETVQLESIKSLPESHYARQYVKNRQIPEQFWDEIFYTEDYQKFLKTFDPNLDTEKIPADPRIVIFYTTPRGKITSVTGRALKLDDKMRYVTFKVHEERKVFGTHRLSKDSKQRVYVTEGQFDSMFLPNAVASGDSNLTSVGDYLNDLGFTDVVLVFDNEPRNRDLVRQIRQAIVDGNKVAILPYNPDAKDINDLVRSGRTPSQLVEEINNNIFEGLRALVKFNEWRKC